MKFTAKINGIEIGTDSIDGLNAIIVAFGNDRAPYSAPQVKDIGGETHSAGKKRGRPRKNESDIANNSDDSHKQSYGAVSFDAITQILREGVDDVHQLSSADIMSQLKRRWKIDASYRQVNVTLGIALNKGLCKYENGLWRLY